MNPLDRATNPQQYDLQDLSWDKETAPDSGRINFFLSYLQPHIKKWEGKRVFEIGAGTGWLMAESLRAGASLVRGIEPSKRNIEQAKHEHPGIDIRESSLEAYKDDSRFDVAVAVMSFPHIRDVDAALTKVRSMLDKDGEVFLVVSDYAYSKMPRHQYTVEHQPIDDDQYAVSVTRTSGTLADVIRKRSVFVKAASQAGLVLEEAIPMKPTEDLIRHAPQYAKLQNKALTHLLHFRVV